MKRFVLFFITLVMVYTSCTVGTINTAGTKEEQAAGTWGIIQQNMTPEANASNDRLFSDVLSEQEVLLKAVDYAHKIGALDPTYHVYQEIPALLTAKIETPLLLYNVSTGTTNAYLLTAVDTDGTTLINVYVRSAADADIDSFEILRIKGLVNMPEYSTHYITKSEAIRLIKSQFPDKQVSEPIAVTGLHLENSRYSQSHGLFWYFTVGDDSRSNNGTPEEYIIDSRIIGWKTITGGLSDRTAISTGDGGSPHLNWSRMARLDTPLHIFEHVEEARSIGGSMKFMANPIENIAYTPIPLK
jgi:hypothetical protein